MSNEDMNTAQIQAATRIGESQQNTRVAQAYLAAMQNRNLTAIGNTLHSSFQFVGSTGDVHNRETFQATLQKAFTHLQKISLTAEYTSGNQTAHVYSMFFAPSTNPVQTVHILTHEEGRIKKVQVIDDTKFLPEHFKQAQESNRPQTRTA